MADFLSTELGIEITKDLGSYLGAQMLHQRASKHAFNFILDKMRKKLTSWKSKTLSFSGRVVLAQSCLASMPGYVMQTCSLPASVCEEAEAICRNFIWGSGETQRKCHLISWEKICKPKDQGVLGYRNLRLFNRAYMAKLGWQLINNPEKSWVQVMEAKYNCGSQGMPNVCVRSNASNVWRAIANTWDDIVTDTTWAIRDGSNTRFWRDVWIPRFGKLEDLYPSAIPQAELAFPVSFYALHNNWNIGELERMLPDDVCAAIENVMPPSPGQSDFPSWKASSDGQFTLKLIYSVLPDHQASVPNPLF